MYFFASSLVRQTAQWFLFSNGVVFDGVSTAYNPDGTLRWKNTELGKRVLCNNHSVFGLKTPYQLFRVDPANGEVQARVDKDCFDKYVVTESNVVSLRQGRLCFYESISLAPLSSLQFVKIDRLLSYNNRLIVNTRDGSVFDVEQMVPKKLPIMSSGCDAFVRGSYLYFEKKGSGVSVFDLDTESLIFESKVYFRTGCTFVYRDGMLIEGNNYGNLICYNSTSDEHVWNLDIDSEVVSLRFSASFVFCQTELGSIYVIDARTSVCVDELLAVDYVPIAFKKNYSEKYTFRFHRGKVQVYLRDALVDTLEDASDVAPYLFPYRPLDINIRNGVCEVLQQEWEVVRIRKREQYPHILTLQDEYMKDTGGKEPEACTGSVVFYGTSEDHDLYPILIGFGEDQHLGAFLKQKYGKKVVFGRLLWSKKDCAYLRMNDPGEMKVVGTFPFAEPEARVLEFVAKYPDDMISVRVEGELRYGLKV